MNPPSGQEQGSNDPAHQAVVDQFLTDAQPLIQAASQDGPLTVDQLQAVLQEALDRDHLQAFSVAGPQREVCLDLLVEIAAPSHSGLDATKASFARIDPDSTSGTTPVAMLTVAAENLDRWFGPRTLAAPEEVLDRVGTVLDDTAIEADDAAATAAVIGLAAKGQFTSELRQLIGAFGGERLVRVTIAVVYEVCTHWASLAGKDHAAHLRSVLQ